jgi:hypothetical protein
MYSFLSSVDASIIKNNVREQIFSLLWNTGKTLFSDNTYLYTTTRSSWYHWIWKSIAAIWSNPYKKIWAYIWIILTSVCIAPPQASFASEIGKTSTFIVTAYYSPLPHQKSYARGSYEADKKLNWNGIKGASGTPVFTGMIAAPKSYDFGTHIFFEGLWLGRVEDTGGAIVEAWVRWQPHDRIDIWMGYGDEWLKRARAWWVRQVNGTFVSSEEAKNLNTIDLEWISNGRVSLSLFPTTKAQSQWWISSEIIEAFAELGYIVENGNVKKMIYNFQFDQWIVNSPSDDGAGNFGPKTKSAFSQEYTQYTELKKIDTAAIEKARKEMLDERTAWDNKYRETQNSVQAFSNIKHGENSNNVLALQSVLSDEWFFKGKKDGHMKWSTIAALKKYQKANGLKQTGIIDAWTQEALVTDMLEA